MKKNLSLVMFSIFVYTLVLFLSLDLFNYYFSNYIGGLGFYILLFIPVLIVFLNIRSINYSVLELKQVVSLTIWAIGYIIMNQFIVNFDYYNSIAGIRINVLTIGAIQLVSIYYIYLFINSRKDEKIRRNIIKIMLISLFVDTFITLRALEVNPNIAKIMATGDASLSILELKGVSGYSIIYSIVIIFPLLITSLGNLKIRYRMIMSVSIILLLLLVYSAAYTTAIIAIFLGVIIYLFFISSKVFKLIIFPLLITFISLLINPYFVYNILLTVSKNIDIHQISIRLEQLADLIYYSDSSGDTLHRLELYKRSIDAFIQYPISGIHVFDPDYNLSGHSAFLDILGGMGLIGFLPFILFIWYSYRITIRKIAINDKTFAAAIKTSYLILCFIALFNTLITSTTTMMFLLFFVSWYPSFIKKYYKNGSVENY